MKRKDLKVMVKEAMDEDSILLKSPEPITEASVRGVKRKIEEYGTPFLMISAFRGEYGRQENEDRNWELKQSLDQAGLSYIKMPGSGYKGADGEVVVEDSVLVWDELRGDKYRTAEKIFDIGKRLAGEFHQESFIYGGPRPGEKDGDYGIHLYGCGSKKGECIGSVIDEVWAGGPEGYIELVVVSDAAEYWSKIAGKKTQFKEIYNKWKNFKASSKLEAMKKQYYLRLAESKLKRRNK